MFELFKPNNSNVNIKQKKSWNLFTKQLEILGNVMPKGHSY